MQATVEMPAPAGYQSITDEPDDAIPEDTSNRFALLLGTYLKKPILLVPLYILGLLVTIAGIADYATKGDLRYEISAIASLVGGVLLVLAIWLVQNAPYDMMKKLRETLISLRGLNRQLSGNVVALTRTNDRLADAVQQVYAENAVFKDSNKTLTGQITRLESTSHALELITKGAQSSLDMLAQGMADSDSKLRVFVDGLSDELINVKETHGKFYETLLDMEAITERNEALGDKLQHTSDQNISLVQQLQAAATRMDDIAKKMNNSQFTQELRRLLHGIDDLADGPHGLRVVLAGPGDGTIAEEQKFLLLKLLQTVDQTLRDQIETMNSRSATVRSLCLASLT